MSDPIKVEAYWHEDFLEVLNPHDKNEIRRFYFETPKWKNLTHDQLEDIYNNHHDSSGNQVSSGFAYERAIESWIRCENGGDA